MHATCEKNCPVSVPEKVENECALEFFFQKMPSWLKYLTSFSFFLAFLLSPEGYNAANEQLD